MCGFEDSIPTRSSYETRCYIKWRNGSAYKVFGKWKEALGALRIHWFSFLPKMIELKTKPIFKKLRLQYGEAFTRILRSTLLNWSVYCATYLQVVNMSFVTLQRQEILYSFHLKKNNTLKIILNLKSLSTKKRKSLIRSEYKSNYLLFCVPMLDVSYSGGPLTAFLISIIFGVNATGRHRSTCDFHFGVCSSFARLNS